MNKTFLPYEISGGRTQVFSALATRLLYFLAGFTLATLIIGLKFLS